MWIDETRTPRFHSADTDDGVWALDFTTALTNVHHEPLEMGSPTTHGRPDAGYTGLFWRVPRAWTGADVIADGGHEGDAVMGTQGAWAAITGEHDQIDGGATVLAYAGTTSAASPPDVVRPQQRLRLPQPVARLPQRDQAGTRWDSVPESPLRVRRPRRGSP